MFGLRRHQPTNRFGSHFPCGDLKNSKPMQFASTGEVGFRVSHSHQTTLEGEQKQSLSFVVATKTLSLPCQKLTLSFCVPHLPTLLWAFRGTHLMKKLGRISKLMF
jgi:hypothetical protein